MWTSGRRGVSTCPGWRMLGYGEQWLHRDFAGTTNFRSRSLEAYGRRRVADTSNQKGVRHSIYPTAQSFLWVIMCA